MKLNVTLFSMILVALLSAVSVNAQVETGGESTLVESTISSELININTATAEELSEKLSGVGPVKAKAIVAWREEHGPFQHIEELIEVKGIGEKTLEKNSTVLTIGDSHSDG